MQTFDSHQKRLGALWAIYGVICIAKVAWIAVSAETFTVMWGALLNRVPNPYPWMSFFHFMLVLAVAVFVLTAVFAFLAAMTLLTRSRSGRSIALTAGFLALITGPLGVALGVYTIVVLLPRSNDERYGRLSAAA